MRVPGRNPRLEYRLRQRDRIQASPLMAEKFPHLKALTVTLRYYDATGTTRNGELKCKLNVRQARSALWFDCPCGTCARGDFDLSRPLATAVAARRQVLTGELRCPGTQTRGDDKHVPCQRLLRYKLNLRYD